MKKILFVILSCILLVSCTSKKEDSKKEESKPNTSTKNPIATIEFEGLGVMKFELFLNDAPESVANFIELADKKFYDGLKMHRIIKDFMAQGGDPKGDGSGGPGYSIKGEFSSNKVANNNKHLLGTLSMARSSSPDSAGSQFFIMLKDYPSLDGQYAAFGKIIEGQDLLTKINNDYATATDNTPPKKELKIKKITIDKNGNKIPEFKKLDE